MASVPPSIRLAIVSDLHLDHHADAGTLLAEAIARLEADVLVWWQATSPSK